MTRALALVVLACPVFAQAPASTHDPSAARVISADISRFWHVFDGLPQDSASLAKSGAVFQRGYIDSGSVGLHDFVDRRIRSGDHLAAVVAAHARYYGAIRRNTLSVDTATRVRDAIRVSFRRLAALCPEAVFPDVYFLIGAMSSAGTASPHGLLIGVEMNARDDATPIDELDAWHRAVIGRVADLPFIVAHELIHIEQRPMDSEPTVLDVALHEGGADFVGELISGGLINRVQHAYGDAHEAKLMAEFSRARDTKHLADWFYQGDKAKDRPADLGYYEGYKIAEAYYRRAPDKTAAVCRIMRGTDARDLLRQSGYAPR
jgi:hypothetical protein